MADLNKELNEYLLSNKSEKQYKLSIPVVSKSISSFSWSRKRTNEESNDSSWLQETKRECCPTLTRMQRLTAFGLCAAMGALCICLSAMYLPVLLLKARKFALLHTLGSIFFLLSFCFLWGPMSYLRSLFSAERRWFTFFYFVSLFGTLYCSLHLQSTALTVPCIVVQSIAMLSFFVSAIPGGTTGLMFFSRLFKSSVSPTLPV